MADFPFDIRLAPAVQLRREGLEGIDAGVAQAFQVLHLAAALQPIALAQHDALFVAQRAFIPPILHAGQMHQADLRHLNLRVEVGLRHIAQIVVESIEHDAVRRVRIANERLSQQRRSQRTDAEAQRLDVPLHAIAGKQRRQQPQRREGIIAFFAARCACHQRCSAGTAPAPGCGWPAPALATLRRAAAAPPGRLPD